MLSFYSYWAYLMSWFGRPGDAVIRPPVRSSAHFKPVYSAANVAPTSALLLEGALGTILLEAGGRLMLEGGQ